MTVGKNQHFHVGEFATPILVPPPLPAPIPSPLPAPSSPPRPLGTDDARSDAPSAPWPALDRGETRPVESRPVVGTEPALPVTRGLPPKPNHARYATLDVVRGMACLMLLVYHAAFYADHSWSSRDPSTWSIGGLAINLVGRLWIGVPMFFVVSGYCIAASIDSLRRKPRSLGNYFSRRFRRIYPPFWAALVLAVVFTLLVGFNESLARNCLQLPRLSNFTAVDWLANLTATASWLPELLGGDRAYVLSNTWTLCYEEQFYAVTGALLMLTPRRFFLASYGIAAVAVVARKVSRWLGVEIDGYFFDGHWLLFAAGILVYQRINYLRGLSANLALGVMAVGAVYGLSERLFAADQLDRHFGEYLLAACCFSLLLVGIKKWDQRIVAHWSLRPFLWAGTISYSIYLVHFPITVCIACAMARAGWHADRLVILGTIPLCLVVSLGVAWLFHLLVERRFINSPQN